jgi:DNA-binding CsgD family transcriptional regulator
MKDTKATNSTQPLRLIDPRPKTLGPSATDPRPERPPEPTRELVIDGRRYLLLPVDSSEPAPPRRPNKTALAQILTPREMQIVALVAEGHVNKQVAAELGISEWTVSTHLRRIFAKLDVDTRAAMVTKCFEALTSP